MALMMMAAWSMSTYPDRKCAAIIPLVIIYGNDHFLYYILSKYTSKCITCKIFSKFSREAKYPIGSVQVKLVFLC